MDGLRVVTDLAECRAAWEQAIAAEVIWDLWDVRACFQEHFGRAARFLVWEKAGRIAGFLPLSWIQESGCYGYFPGETWGGKTWLEQNRVLADGDGMVTALLEHCMAPYHIRYLLPLDGAPADGYGVDEVGYLFLPPKHGYDIENYFAEFSGKSAKRLKRELAAIEALGVRYRSDEPDDFEHLVGLSVGRFGSRSYFHDLRFREGFRSLMHFLRERGWLRSTTVLVGDEVAAVDMGCVYRGRYTLLAGGTHGGYPGVAKLINIHHMRRACEERFEQADFLCGDFSWKKLFHLAPRPLYLLSNVPAVPHALEGAAVGSASCVR